MEYIVVYPRRRFYFITSFARLTKLPQFRGVLATAEPLCFVALPRPPRPPHPTPSHPPSSATPTDDFLSVENSEARSKPENLLAPGNVSSPFFLSIAH